MKLKKPLFNLYVYTGIIFLLPLVFFFIYATYLHSIFYVFIILGLLIIIFYLVPLRKRLQIKYAEKKLHMQNLQEGMNVIQAEIEQEEISIESLKDKVVNYAHLKDVTERLSRCLYTEETSKVLSAEAEVFFGQKDRTIILYLFHSKTGTLGLSSSRKGQMRINIKSKKGDIFDQWVVKTMQPLLIEDTKMDYRFDVEKIMDKDARLIRSLISVPLMVRNKALGILRVDSPKENDFKTEDLRFLSTVGDIGALAIENAQLYERVEQLAIRDGLTNLYLRRYLLKRLPEEISRKIRRDKPLTFIMFDLDYFKDYNDKFGHIAGDIVLKTISRELFQFFQEPGCLVCRYGGEEFGVLLPDVTKEEGINLANTIRENIGQKTIILRREKTSITVSAGVSSFPEDARLKDELIAKADQALYRAKKKGRNRVCAA